MKVSELLEGTWDEERGEYYPSDREQAAMDAGEEAAKEEFHNNYIELGGSTAGSYEDVEYVMREVLTKKRDANFQEAQKVIDQLNQAFDKNIDIYVPKSIEPKLDQLWDVIDSDEANPNVVMQAIQQFFALIGKGMTTEEEWMDSEEAQSIRSEVGADYEPDPYRRYGVRPSDFY